MKQTKDSSYLKDVKHFDYKAAMDSTAPGAVKQADVPSATPDMGTKSVSGKADTSGKGDPFAYKFSTKTPVTQAEGIPGARNKACDVQEGTNKSKLLPSAPPTGSSAKDGEEKKFETSVIGVP